MLQMYKRLLSFGLNNYFLNAETTSNYNKLDSLVANNAITTNEKEIFEKVRVLLDNLKEEVDNGLEVSNESIYVRNLVKELLASDGKLQERGIKLVSDDGEYSIYNRKSGENGIKVSNEKLSLTDQGNLLGDLNYEGYTLENALLEVDSILNIIAEAQIFNTPKLEKTLTELRESFRLKYASMIKDELI